VLDNDRLLRALLRKPVDRTPVWIMRQAGRYLPEYRAIRKKIKDFLTLCKTPELATEITLQPIERFPLDAAIIFSDILTIPDAFGLGLQFIEGEGPRFQKTVRSLDAVRALPRIDPEVELRYVMDAIRFTQQSLASRLPLLGFSGSPWTLATYMVEGKSSKQFTEVKRLLFQNPTLLHQLLSHLTSAVTDYLNAQIAAGVDAVMIFDTWGGLLSPTQYAEFSLDYMKQIVNNLNRVHHLKQAKIPVILFTKNGGLHLDGLVETGCDAIALDWTADLHRARQQVGSKVALQGNLDPSALYGSPLSIYHAVRQILDQFGQGTGHVFNLGHGIHPDIDPEHVSAMIEAVRDLSPSYHN